MSQASLPSVEIVQGGPAPGAGDGSRAGPRRVLTFAAVFMLITVVGMAWNYSRPALYRAAVTVLTVKPKAVDARSAEADLEHVAIQGRALLNAALLRGVAARINEEIVGAGVTESELRLMLTWTPVTQTNLIELSADGHEPTILRAAVNHWARAYEAHRQVEIASAKAGTMAELEDQQATLQTNIDNRQQALANFREQHEIVSLESADNRAPAELKGLNAALNKARERLVEAESKRVSIEHAISQGKTVMPPESRKTFSELQLAAANARARLDKLEERFTQSYIDRDPDLRGLPARVEELDKQVELMRALGQQQALEQAEETDTAARIAVAELEKRLGEHQIGARTFAGVFGEHEALTGEVAKLQQVHAANAKRLAEIEARNVERYPPVQVIGHAGLPAQPISPDFGRDAKLVLAVAVIAALFATWLVDYLSAQRRSDTGAYTAVRVYAAETGGHDALSNAASALSLVEAPAARLAAPSAHALLELAEVETLLGSADEPTAAMIALLLSGIAPLEFAFLEQQAFVADELLVVVPAPTVRQVELSASAWQRLQVCRQATGTYPAELECEDLDAALAIAAIDAGLPDPGRFTAANLWQTYAVFLVRQGLRLADLSKIIGPLPSAWLQTFSRYSPPGQNQPIEHIDRIYPLLQHEA